MMILTHALGTKNSLVSMHIYKRVWGFSWCVNFDGIFFKNPTPHFEKLDTDLQDYNKMKN